MDKTSELKVLQKLFFYDKETPGAHWPLIAVMSEVEIPREQEDSLKKSLIEKDLIKCADRAPGCVAITEKGRQIVESEWDNPSKN